MRHRLLQTYLTDTGRRPNTNDGVDHVRARGLGIGPDITAMTDVERRKRGIRISVTTETGGIQPAEQRKSVEVS